MIELELDRQSLDAWQVGVSRKFRKNFESAQNDIRQAWQVELYRQSQTSGDGRWQGLDPIYEARKEKRFPGMPILQRTGVMLEGYVDGINFGETTKTTVSVIMPYPEGNIGVRAMSHQGETGQPKGVPQRSFDIEKFEDIAIKRINEAMKKATE